MLTDNTALYCMFVCRLFRPIPDAPNEASIGTDAEQLVRD